MSNMLQRIAYIEAETDAIRKRVDRDVLWRKLRAGDIRIEDMYDVEILLPDTLDFLKYTNVKVSVTSKMNTSTYCRLFFGGNNITWHYKSYLVGTNAFERRIIDNQCVANFPDEALIAVRVGWCEFSHEVTRRLIV